MFFGRRISMPALMVTVVAAICLAFAAGRMDVGRLSPGSNVATGPAAHGTQGTLIVHFLDVGQADSILLELPNGQAMLIDAGTNRAGATVCDAVRAQGISRLDYVVGTHPHEDHIGGLDDVIKSFDIGKLYMPKVQNNTKTFEDVLDAAAEKGLKIITAKAGVHVTDGGGLSIDMLAPVGETYDELNNYSAVIKVVFGNTAFLFMGDAEELAEQEITGDVQADVLKVGHHGSKTSTSDAFLKRVNPQYAIIQCGKDNSYGHPSQETVDKLTEAGIQIYRTDQDGTVRIISDGKTVSATKEGPQ